MTDREIKPLEFSEQQQQLIRDTFANGASPEEFGVLMEVARGRRLNPFLRQIYFVKRWDSGKRRDVWSTQTSIDGLRAVADRTGLYAGQDEPEYVEGNRGILCCKVRVYRKDWEKPAVGVAYFEEYVQRTKDGELTQFWKRMPHVMIAKCAEALALRKAFPEDTSGLYVAEEMGNEPEPERITAPPAVTQVTAPTPPAAQLEAPKEKSLAVQVPASILAAIYEVAGDGELTLQQAASIFDDHVEEMDTEERHAAAKHLRGRLPAAIGASLKPSEWNAAVAEAHAKRPVEQPVAQPAPEREPGDDDDKPMPSNVENRETLELERMRGEFEALEIAGNATWASLAKIMHARKKTLRQETYAQEAFRLTLQAAKRSVNTDPAAADLKRWLNAVDLERQFDAAECLAEVEAIQSSVRTLAAQKGMAWLTAMKGVGIEAGQYVHAAFQRAYDRHQKPPPTGTDAPKASTPSTPATDGQLSLAESKAPMASATPIHDPYVADPIKWGLHVHQYKHYRHARSSWRRHREAFERSGVAAERKVILLNWAEKEGYDRKSYEGYIDAAEEPKAPPVRVMPAQRKERMG